MEYGTVIISILLYFTTESNARLEPLEQPLFKLSLCKCVLAASSEYIETKETITLSLPTTDYFENVTSVITSSQVLLTFLTNEMKWTILTTNMKKYNDSSNYYSLEKISRSYIICIRSLTEISKNLKKLKTLNSWNPHSKFFVVSATIFENPSDSASKILQALWEEDLIEAVVFLANPKNLTVFDAYVPKPSMHGNCSKNLGKIRVANSCSMGVFQIHAKNLFPKTVYKSLNCTLSIGYVKVAPFVMIVDNNSIEADEYNRTDNGLEVNLVDMIADFLKIKPIYFESQSGEIFLNGSATDNLLLLKEGKVDIAIGSYVKTFARSYYFDSSDTYLQDRLMFCVPHFPVVIDSQNFLNILDTTTWILLIALYVVTVSLLWFMSKISQTERSPYRDYKNVSQYVFSILLGFPVRVQPRTLQVRVMFIFLVLFSFYMVSAYQSYLTSVLTGSRFVEKYNTVDDIYKYKLKTYFVPNSERYFQDQNYQYVRDKMIECDDFKKCMDYVAFRRDSAFGVQKMYVDYIFNSYVSKGNDPLLHCFGNIVSVSINMLIRKGFPLFDKINRLIRRITAAGFITKWKKDILRAKAGNFVSSFDVVENNAFLRLKNLSPVFVALIVGHSIAVIIFVVELRFGKKYDKLRLSHKTSNTVGGKGN